MCGCDFCNGLIKRPEPDCCPNCDAAEARLEQQRLPWSDPNSDPLADVREFAESVRESAIRPYRSITIDGQRLIEYGPVLNPANPHTRMEGSRPQGGWTDEINDFTAGGTA